jgi:SpoVK/Ycf46/Vps4 family AAA+-type ATPase
VFEDFDANDNDIIKKRKDSLNENRKKRENEETDSEISGIEDNIKTKILNEFKLATTFQKLEDEISLEYILNVLDGIVELYDIIVFFTTNYIHIIDPALKRSGRVDRIIHMKKAIPSIIHEMLAYHYTLGENEMNGYEETIHNIPHYTHSYSDISQICNYSHTMDDCLREIAKI